MKKIALLLLLLAFIFPLYAQSSEDILRLLVEKKIITAIEADSLLTLSKEKTNSIAAPAVVTDSTTSRPRPITMDEVIKAIASAKVTDPISDQKAGEQFGISFSGIDSKNLKLWGYGQVGFTYNSMKHQPVSFHLNRLMLMAQGRFIPKFYYYIMLDLGPAIQMHEMWLKYEPFKELGIRMGQFRTPFSMEGDLSLSTIETMMYSNSVMKMAHYTTDPYNGVTPCGAREVGIEISGSAINMEGGYSLLDYRLGIFNGTGFNVAWDNNVFKDIQASLYIHPIKDLKIGGSAIVSKGDFKENVKMHNSNGLVIDSAIHLADQSSYRVAAGLEYAGKNFYLRGEYLHAFDYWLQRSGFYLATAYKVIPRLQVVAKVDFYNPNIAVADNWWQDYTLGLNYTVYKRCRAMLHYTYRRDFMTMDPSIGHKVELQLQFGL